MSIACASVTTALSTRSTIEPSWCLCWSSDTAVRSIADRLHRLAMPRRLSPALGDGSPELRSLDLHLGNLHCPFQHKRGGGRPRASCKSKTQERDAEHKGDGWSDCRLRHWTRPVALSCGKRQDSRMIARRAAWA